MQESKLSSASSYTNFPKYFYVRRDRPNGRGGGGLLTLIHHDVIFTTLNIDNLIPSDSIIEHQGFTLAVDDAKLSIIYIYAPLISCWPIGYRPNMQRFLACHDEDTHIVGNFNAHNSAWISQPGSDQQSD